jgi:PAS domain S-box-containing protein
MPTLEGRDFKPYLDMVKNFLSGKHTSKSFEFPYTRKDGSTGIGDAYIGMIKVNKKRELIAILKDITDKKKNEEEYQNIFKNSPEGIILIDFDGNVKDINSSASNMLNINGIEYFGKNIFNLQREIGQNKIHFKDVYDILINKGSIEPFEIELNFNDNIEYIEISVGLIKVFEDILGIQFILRDVTDQKNIEKERIAYTEKLETLVQERTNQIVDNEKMVTMAKVSSMIAHDLKGPLQVIQNTLYLMQLKPEN